MVTTRGRSASTLVEQPQLPSLHKRQANGDHHTASIGKSAIKQATETRSRKKRTSIIDHAPSTSTSPEIKRRRTDSGSNSPILSRTPLLEEPHAAPEKTDGNGVDEGNAFLQTTDMDVLVTGDSTAEADQESKAREESIEETSVPVLTPTPEPQTGGEAPTISEAPPEPEDIIAQAAKAAEAALLGYSQSETPSISTPLDQAPTVSPSLSELQQPSIQGAIQQGANFIYSTSDPRPPQQMQNSSSQDRPTNTLQNHVSPLYAAPPGQTQPTAVLYESARRIANSKSTNNPRNPATSASQRRPWTIEEERALMDGLDHVKGPHWSQILILYGPGGSINETLRDRTQVQLKDKARNLKLFFLKSGIEVPYYLSFVTGDLRSRTSAHGTAGTDGAAPSTTSAQSRQSNGSGPSTPVAGSSRTRYPPASIAPPISTTSFSPLLSFSAPNTVYSSPYAPIGNLPDGLSSDDNQESSIDKGPSQQDVADLASSAAAQVAAALANFNGLDLPGLDLSASLGIKVDSVENDNPAEFGSVGADSQIPEDIVQNSMNTDSVEHTPPPPNSNAIETSALSEGIKTFDTH